MAKEIKAIRGIIPARPTPFTKDDEINYEVYGHLGHMAGLDFKSDIEVMQAVAERGIRFFPIDEGTLDYVHGGAERSAERGSGRT